MLPRTSKTQPLSKTIVTEFKIQVADLHLRSKILTGSQAVRVPGDSNFTTSDATVTPEVPLTLTAIRVAVAIHSYEPFVLELTNASGTISGISCSGLFVFYGSLDQVVIRSAGPGISSRLTFLYA